LFVGRPNGAVTGLFNGGNNIFYADHIGQLIHGCAFGGKVHCGMHHAVDSFVERTLYIGRAVGTCHTGDGECNRLLAHRRLLSFFI
jgi:hypothetical protein